ncbi:MAG: GNAT family protein [Peptostreptococcaceae bacterium]|nr:GNAT family protein [Peptostreptococcaceae bacterium]
MITLRKAKFDDCTYFHKWESDDNVIQFLSIPKGKTYEEVVREFIKREQDDTMMDFAVLLNGEMIGRAYLSRYDKNTKSIDITRIYIGEQEHRGKGLGRVMMLALMRFCFEKLELNRVTLDYFDGNPAQAMYEALGFAFEGVAREAGYKDGAFYNFNLMSMLQSEWKNRNE